MKLRPYQQECINSIINAAKKGVTKQLVVMPTGTGKTVTFGSLPSLVKAKGKKTLILAHREELLTQAADKISKIDPSLRIGIEQGTNKIGADVDIVVASVPTLGRQGSKRIEKFAPNDFGLIIIDEAHHSTSQSYKNILEYFNVLKGKVKIPNGRVLLGVTATPLRADKVGLDEIFDKIVYTYSLREAIDSKYLSNIEAYSVETQEDISHVHTRMGDFADGELAEAVDTDTRNKLIVESYTKIAPHTKALIFAASVEHTKNLTAMFCDAGYKAKFVVGDTDKMERSRTFYEFEHGDLEVLINCMVATEGYDNPNIKTIMMARPTKSSVLYQQMIGRGLRIAENKKGLKLIDFVDNTGKNSIITLPNLFGVPKKLKGIDGKKITEVSDIIEKILEVNPDYNVGGITDWSKENIEKIIKRIDIFSQAELSEDIKQYSRLSWARYKEGYRLQFPAKEEEVIKEDITIQLNLLNKYEIRVQKFQRVVPSGDNGYRKWVRVSEEILGSMPNLEGALNIGDNWVSSNKADFRAMVDQKAKWRTAEPSEKQITLLKKLGIAVPQGLSKGQASILISKALNNKHSISTH
jgi:ATP-dependent helicase IRC3